MTHDYGSRVHGPGVSIRRRLRSRFLGLQFGVCVLALVGCAFGATPEVRQGSSMDSAQQTSAVAAKKPSPWTVNFRTMPDGALDPNKWNFSEGTTEADYNGEAQTYTSRKKNVRVKNGALVIQARPERRDGRDFTSARINTRGIFDFKYGTIEVTAKLPKGVGTWPAAWLMPSNPIYDPRELGVPEGDPDEFAVNGEIDFLEAIGRHPGQNIPAAHSYNQKKKGPIYTPAMVKKAYTRYHRYGLIKKPGVLKFTLDGKVYATRKPKGDGPLWWPFEQNYYLIINQALGGDWAGAEKEKFPPHGIDVTMSDHWKYRIRKITYKPLP